MGRVHNRISTVLAICCCCAFCYAKFDVIKHTYDFDQVLLEQRKQVASLRPETMLSIGTLAVCNIRQGG